MSSSVGALRPRGPAMSSPVPWPGAPEDRRRQAGRRAARAWFQRRRRLLGLLCLAAAVLLGLRTLAPAPPRTTPVWVAAHDLAAGSVLETSDLRQAAWPPDAVPSGSLAPTAAVGRPLATPVRAGEALTDSRLLGPGLLTGHEDLVLTSVPLAAPEAAALVRPGDRVDLLDPTTGTTIATSALTLAVPTTATEGGGLLGGASHAAPSGQLILAVPAETARRLATTTAPDPTGTTHGLTLTIRAPP